MNTLGIYIHIPFCKSKCFYCDFYSSCDNNKDIISQYIDAVCKEILSNAELFYEKKIETIYIGGGTPSVLEIEELKKFLDVLKLFNISPMEVTVEINPENTTKEKLQAYFDMGINRLSIGLQSANNDTLKKIGRLATKEDFLRVYNDAVEVGFKNISCDVIIGLPDETLEDFKNTINFVLGLKHITHISSYSLEVHENTKLDFLINNGFVTLPDEETEREMKHFLDSKLKEAGFERYEISNYAKPGFESKHNLKYWNQEEYLGFGAAAASFLNSTRYSNIKDTKKYIENILTGTSNKEEIEEMDKLDLIKEYVILRLRLKDGVNFDTFKSKFKMDIFSLFKDIIEKLVLDGLLVKTDDRIYLTDKGEDLANIVWQEFI